MPELTTSQLIKIIIGIFVVVVVVLGIFLFFRGTVIDFFKNLIGGEGEGEFGGAGASRDIEGEDMVEEELDLKAECEASDCTSKDPVDLKCGGFLNNVQGYYYKCTKKGCVRKALRDEVEDCNRYGCTNGVCNECLESGTPVKLFGSPPFAWCCDGEYCAERGLFGACAEWRCK